MMTALSASLPSSAVPMYPPLLIRTLAVGSLPTVEGPKLTSVIVQASRPLSITRRAGGSC